MPTPALSIKNLSIQYAQTTQRAINNVSFDLNPGDIACLLGPSGCGKTTILRAIAGFIPPSEGHIWLKGQHASTPQTVLSPEKRQVGVVFQDYALFPHLSVRKNIEFGLHKHSTTERKTRGDNLLALIGLSALADRFPHELSGGQQQRVALARALAPRPTLILLDEPFSNLDVELKARLSTEVRDILKAEHMSAILVTHDQHEAFAMADHIGVIHAGELQQWDTPYQLYHEPKTRMVADFIGQGVFVHGKPNANGIQIALGQLPHAKQHPAPHQELDVLIRPDDIIHDDASPSKAKVLRKSFRGAEFMYTLELNNGEHILALVPSHHDHAIGEHIGIRLELDHVITFNKV
jgi:iron(III) transport system ATP-binding protein